MIDLIEKLNYKFNNKYSYLKLLNVEYDKDISQCVITFLYPCTIKEISEESRNEINLFFQEFLSLNGSLKVKLKKSFLDEKLIVNEIVEFFKIYKKGLLPYITLDNIKSENNELNVNIKIFLNQDVLSLVDDYELRTQIKSYLDKYFIADFNIEIIENEETLPDTIEVDDILPIATKTKRYDVNIIKYIAGKEIVPKPEFIEENKHPKESVILAGYLSNLQKKSFIAKKGKKAGTERIFYTFTLRDKGASIDCVYFCGKTHEKDMDNLEDLTFLLCVGDLKIGLNGKLTYYIRKVALASLAEQEIIVKNNLNEPHVHKRVVFPERLQRQAQANLFEEKQIYNDFISKNSIVVFDIETTGLDPENCEITELGAVKIQNGEIIEKFESFAKPKNPIPIEVQELTHITDEMVATAPSIEDVIQDFYDWSKDCIISGYNIVSFDMKFVKKVANNLGLKFNNDIIDTMIVVRQSSLRVGNFKLGTVVKALGLTLNDAHRAYNDAYATAQVLMALNKLK